MISVVIPTYNGGPFLEETLASLAAQRRRPDEVLLVDDGSTAPRTRRLLEQLRAGRGPLPVRVLQQANQGPGAARNLGVREARGELVLPLDDDDLLTPDALGALEAALAATPGAAFAYGHTELFGAKRGVEVTPRFNPFLQLLANALVVTALMRRSVFTEAGLAWPSLAAYEDWSLWLAVAEAGLCGVAVEAPLLRYRVKRRAGRMAAALRRTEELQAHVRALHPRSFSLEAQAALKVRFAPGLELVWDGDALGAVPSVLEAILGRQQLDDVAVRLQPASAGALLGEARGRFLLACGPPELDALARARPSLFDQAVRVLESHPRAAALVVPTSAEAISAQARAPRLCLFPAARPLAAGDLLFVRTAACAELLAGELRAEPGPRGPFAPWLRALAAGRGLLLAQDFTGLLARGEPVTNQPALAPLPPPGPPRRGPLYRAWRLARGVAVALAGEERVAAALQPLKTALSERRRVAARDAAWVDQSVRPRALAPSRRKELALLEEVPVRHQRGRPLAKTGRARVAIATHLLTTGGVERALIDLCAALPRDRYELVAITTLPAAHEWEWRLAPHVDDVVHFGGLVPQAQIPQAIVELLQARGCDALLTINCWEGYQATALARKVLPRLRTMDYQHTDFQQSGADFARVSCIRYRDCLDMRVVSTNYLRARYQQYGVDPGGVQVIRSACDEQGVFHPGLVPAGRLRARLGLGPGVPLVGFAGRMVPEKDPLFVLSVYAAIAALLPEARFVFAGEGPLLAEARALASRPPLSGRVEFVSSQTPMPELLRDLSLLLMASRQEGLPLVFTEAMALQTPVVTTAVEGIPELVTEGVGACVANAPDPDVRRRLLVEAALPILRDPARRQRLGLAARARIEHDFGIEATRAAWRRAFAALAMTEGGGR